jgi:H+-transporting ATPase
LADVTIAATLAIAGIAMAPLPIAVIAALFAASAVFSLVLALLKRPVFAHFAIT